MPISDILERAQKPPFVAVTVRITEKSQKILRQLAEKYNLSQGAVINALLSQEKVDRAGK